jgi:hypothetical protein
MKLSANQVNYLNIGLMLLSCIVAFRFPFELFLFSYAILGPLHYLTEISWLHEKNYFTESGKGKKARVRPNRHWLILVAATMCALILGFVAAEILHNPISPKWEITMFYLVLITALLITEMRSQAARVVVFILAVLSLFVFSGSRYYIVLAFFIVTIIHVFIFTGAFILHGAIRSRSSSGILSLVVFVMCAATFFFYVPGTGGHPVGAYVRNSYHSFNALNAELIKLFNLGSGSSSNEIYESSVGLMIMRLIAFAYTYHYLNWFSKTSIIRWYEVPKSRTVIIGVVWLASIALYAYNYDAGMAILYFISILHVMLEFPLNHRTFAGIGRELYTIAK